ncbi:hypothetical protein [Symbiopectobacterium sp. RP]|uniref:hypothetical protein n=1 Tax=Symbiopectobacterium sp. RP TaxID=3248553 RepID=UPI003D2A1186
MITDNALICGKKIQLIVIKIMSLDYNGRMSTASLPNTPEHTLSAMFFFPSIVRMDFLSVIILSPVRMRLSPT